MDSYQTEAVISVSHVHEELLLCPKAERSKGLLYLSLLPLVFETGMLPQRQEDRGVREDLEIVPNSYFIRFPEFVELTELSESSYPLRENSNSFVQIFAFFRSILGTVNF